MLINKHLEFEDLYSFWAYAFQESRARRRDSRYDSPSDWNGNVSWEATKELAIRGWDEGLDEIDKLAAEISPQITDKVIKATPKYQVAGYNVDVGRYLSGDPECFQVKNAEVDVGVGKVVTLVCSISFSCVITASVIIQRGAMICALVDALEAAGNRVEVVCNDASSYLGNSASRSGENKSSGWFEVDVCVKKPEEALNMIELAFCLAHPAMLRRMMFSAAELEGWSDFTPRYGKPAQATQKGDLYIEEVFSGIVSNNKAIAWVLEQLKQMGVNIETCDLQG